MWLLLGGGGEGWAVKFLPSPFNLVSWSFAPWKGHLLHWQSAILPLGGCRENKAKFQLPDRTCGVQEQIMTLPAAKDFLDYNQTVSLLFQELGEREEKQANESACSTENGHMGKVKKKKSEIHLVFQPNTHIQ